MTDAPKRIAFRKKYMSDAITNGPLMDDPEYVEYHHAALSADLVRAALEAAADKIDAKKKPKIKGGGWHVVGPDPKAAAVYQARTQLAERIRAMSSDPEAIAAIVARVTEGK